MSVMSLSVIVCSEAATVNTSFLDAWPGYSLASTALSKLSGSNFLSGLQCASHACLCTDVVREMEYLCSGTVGSGVQASVHPPPL